MDHASRLLDRIHADKIRPVPLWRVRVRRLGRFALFGSVVVLGTVSVALAVQGFHAHGGRGWLVRQTMAEYAPLVWLATAVLMVWAGIRLFRELPRGWRVRPGLVGAVLIAVCLLGGIALEHADGLTWLHRAIARRVPAYREVWQHKALASWHDPAAGRLSGSWTSDGDSSNGFLDVEGVRWNIRWEASESRPDDSTLRLLGRVCGPAIFCADDWRPAPGFGNNRAMR